MDSPPVNSLGTDLVTSMKQAGESKTFDSQVSRGFSQGWVPQVEVGWVPIKIARDLSWLVDLYFYVY